MKILVINSGSSSIKFKLFDMPKQKLCIKGAIEHIGEKGSAVKDHYQGLRTILKGLNHVQAIGHRVVHGAERFRKPAVITASIIAEIQHCAAIAPLHNPANLAGILACQKLLPQVAQVAVFDTAFHQTIPDYAYIYGLPFHYYTKHRIRKYGFHGTSHEYVAHEAAKILRKPPAKLKIITCHLGNGCSIAAVDKGRSVDTSMGFTPLEGLLMGTRCGDLDPALVPHIMRIEKLTAEAAEKILNKQSGLLGISGISNDMRYLEKAEKKGNQRARLAVDVFIYRIRKYIGAYAAVMGGADAVVFTAGIGENQGRVRQRITRGLFDYFKRRPKVLVVATNEELMIARQAYKLIVAKRGLKEIRR